MQPQLEKIKQQVIEHITSTFPQEKQTQAIEQINSMQEEEFKEFLVKNNLIKSDGTPNEQQCIFCAIANNQIPSTKIDETPEALAILELNPISEGHTIIIPKQHSTKEQIPQSIFDFAKQISEKIKNTFNPKDILIESQNLFGHEIINILPIYSNETLSSPKTQKTPEELKVIQQQIQQNNKQETEQEPIEDKDIEQEEINEKNTWLPRRMP